MADLIAEGARTLTFVRSRRGAELTALGARARLEDIAPELAGRVASYRAGYLAEDRTRPGARTGRGRSARPGHHQRAGAGRRHRRAWTRWCWPASPARSTSFWQQAGRSGRRGQGALIVLIARDDPLDTYLVHHPAALLDKPIERVVIDPGQSLRARPAIALRGNRTAARPTPRCAPGTPRPSPTTLVDDGLLRRRPAATSPRPAWIRMPRWTSAVPSGGQIAIVETETGRLLGSAGAGQAPAIGSSRRGVPAPGRDVRRRLARLRGRHRVRARRGSRLRDVRARAHRHRRDRSGERTTLRAGHHRVWCRCR